MPERSTKRSSEAEAKQKSSRERKNQGIDGGSSARSGDRRRFFWNIKSKDGNIKREETESGRASYDQPCTTPPGSPEDRSTRPRPFIPPGYKQSFADTETHNQSRSFQGIAGMAPSPVHSYQDTAPNQEAAAKEDHAAENKEHIKQEFGDTDTAGYSRTFQALDQGQVKGSVDQKFANTKVGEHAYIIQGAISVEMMALFLGQDVTNQSQSSSGLHNFKGPGNRLGPASFTPPKIV